MEWETSRNQKTAKKEMERGCITYGTLADALGEISFVKYEKGEQDVTVISGSPRRGDGRIRLIEMYAIITKEAAKLLEEETTEYVLYDKSLGLYLWGMPVWGTNWREKFTELCVKK